MKKTYLIKLICCLFIISGTIACGNSASKPKSTKQKIDELVSKYHEIGQFNGCLLVVKDGKVIYNKAFGVANFETGEPLTIDHRFRLASVTKQFTGMAIMILKEQGKLDFDDDIQKYLPDLPYENISIRNLLTHTSGLPDYLSLMDRYWDTVHVDITKKRVATNTDALEFLIKYHPPIEFEPGEKYAYSNTGYNMLALIVEKASGMTYHDFMKTHIFGPLGMDNSFVNSPDGINPVENRALGFRLKPDGITYENSDFHYQNGVYGDGGIYTTTGDMFKWDQAIYNGTLVSKETWEEATSPAILNDKSPQNYGFGWSLIPSEYGLVVAHGGGWVGFRTFNLIDLEHKNAVVQLCNTPGVGRGNLAFAIYDILHGKEVEMPKRPIGITLLYELQVKNMEQAIKLYYELKEEKSDEYIFAEDELNLLGYRLINQERIQDAIEIFKLNVKEYPDAWNVYDSLGEAYMLNEEFEKSRENYLKSLELNPDNDNARRMLERLE
jgi:CubicO group peptidase (beta-lactamase class C family)